MDLDIEKIRDWLFQTDYLPLPNYTFLICFLIVVLAYVLFRKRRANWQSVDFDRRTSSRRAEDNFPTEKELSKMDETIPAQKFTPKE